MIDARTRREEQLDIFRGDNIRTAILASIPPLLNFANLEDFVRIIVIDITNFPILLIARLEC